MIKIVCIKKTTGCFYVIIKNDMILLDDFRIRFSNSSFYDILDFIRTPKTWVPAKRYININRYKEQNNFKIMCEFANLSDMHNLKSTHPEFFI